MQKRTPPNQQRASCHQGYTGRLNTNANIIALKRHLMRALPVELVDIIFSIAEFWPHVSNLSSGPQNFKEKQLPISPPTLADLYNKDTLLVQSAPLGLSKQILHPWLSPKMQYPARMLVVEVRARRVNPAGPTYKRPSFLRASHTWIEIGVVDHAVPSSRPRSLPPSDIERRERDALLSPRYSGGGERATLKPYFEVAYYKWLERRRSVVPGSLKLNLFVDDYLQGQSATMRAVYRFDDDCTDLASSYTLSPEWELTPEVGRTLSEASHTDFIQFVKTLDEREKIDGAEFVRGLQVGDEVGVWSRGMSHGFVDGAGNVAVIEGVKVTVFWEI